MIGQEGMTLTEFKKIGDNWEGKVIVRGENWRAQASEAIDLNTRIWVHGITGLTLLVKTTSLDPQQSEHEA